LKKYFVLCLLAVTINSRSQEVVHNQTLYWLYYSNQLYFTPKVYWVNNIDNRRFINPDKENQLIYHTRLHFKTGKWDLAGGVSLSSIYTQIPANKSTHVATEFRPVIEATHEFPIGKIYLQNRVRLDNRFLETRTQQSVLDTFNYVLRFRYRIQMRIPFLKDKDGNTVLQVRLSDEIMFNHKENIFDQNRIYGTLDYNVNKNFTLEAGYIYIYQQRYAREEFYSRNTIRIGLQHRIFLKQKKD
jgi:hypothetical protein